MSKDLLFRLKGQSDLAQALVADLPEHLFTSTDTLFYDPAMGGGQYLQEILNRCKKYHQIEDILPRIYGAEESTIHINWVKRNTQLGGANLTKDCNEFANLKFDVIVSNPPYQDNKKDGGQNKIYNAVCKAALDQITDGGVVSLITPTAVLKQSKRFSLFGNKNLKLVDFTAGARFGGAVCRWIVDHSHTDGVTVVTSDGNQSKQGYNQPVRDLIGVNPIFAKVYDALSTHCKVISNRMFSQNPVDTKRGRSDTQSDEFNYPVYKIVGDKDVLVQYNKPTPKLHGKLSYVICMTKKFDKSNTRVSELDYDVNHVAVEVTQEQAKNVESFLFSDYFVELVAAWKKLDGYGFNNAIKYLPKFDINRSWDSASVKEYVESFL